MNELKRLSNSFEKTLKDTDLQDLSADVLDNFTDNIIKEGLLKDIPILSTIIGASRVVISLSERLLLKKIISFITEIKDIDPSKRQKVIEDIENSEKYQIKVGEKLLYIIDKCEDHISAKYIAILFTAFLKNELSYEEYLRGAGIIQKIFIPDLEVFINTPIAELETEVTVNNPGITDFQNSLINSGICIAETDIVRIRDQDDWKQTEKYVVEGGNTVIYLSEIGHTLKKVLKYSC